MASISRRTTMRGVRYDVRFRTPTGEPRKKTFRTLTEARAYATEIESQKNRGTFVDPRGSATPFDVVATEWLTSNPGKRTSTRLTDEAELKNRLLPELEGTPLSGITPSVVQRIVNRLDERYAARTVRRTYGVLRAVLAFAVERDLIGRSPCRGIRLPRVDSARRTDVDANALVRLSTAMGDKYGVMAWVGALTGLRWGEVAALRVRSLDVLRNELTVREAIVRGAKGEPTFGPPKSAAGVRTMTIPVELSAMLAAHLERQGLTGADGDALLFPNARGGPLAYQNWRKRIWVPACITAGLGRFEKVEGGETYVGAGFHDLRRANATALVATGVDVRTAQERMGQADPRTMLAIYAAATTDADRAAAVKLAEHFTPSEAAVDEVGS